MWVDVFRCFVGWVLGVGCFGLRAGVDCLVGC